MNFLRTKTTIFEVVEENERVYRVRSKKDPNNIYSKSKSDHDIIRIAGTIDELVDVYVLDDRKDKHHYIENDISLLPCIYIYDKENTSVYGEIWVGGELHKVAKLNDEGKLELL